MRATGGAVRILQIDDSVEDAELIRQHFANGALRHSVKVDLATLLRDGLVKLSGGQYDAVILDLRLPEASPDEVLRQVLAHADSRPIIIIAESDSEDIAIRALHAGAQDYLIKEWISSESLARAVDLAIGKTRRDGQQRDRQLLTMHSEAKSAFLSYLSHEIRTPLSTIIGFSELLLQDAATLGEERSERLVGIWRSSQHLLSLVGDLIDLSKLQLGDVDVSLRRVNLREELSRTVEAIASTLVSKRLKLSLKCPGPLPETILTDPEKFQRILINLLTSAVKYTDSGTITLSVTWQQPHAGPAQLDCRITTESAMFDPGLCTALLQPAAPRNRQTAWGGNAGGVDLALARYLARQLGGDLWVIDRDGHSAGFGLQLAIGSIEEVKLVKMEEGLADQERANHRMSIQERLQGRLTGSVILLAEDAPDIQLLIESYLKWAGADLITCQNGQEAVELALSHPVDVVLMDIEMPKLNGYDATRALRQKGFARPIIALTAHALELERQRGFASGCNGFLSKPVRPEVLIETVESFLVQARHANDAGDAPLRSVYGDDDAVIAALPVFIASVKQRTEEMNDALRQNDWVALARVAHRLKGAASCYGYPDLSQLAQRLEILARDHGASHADVARTHLASMVTFSRRIERGQHTNA